MQLQPLPAEPVDGKYFVTPSIPHDDYNSYKYLSQQNMFPYYPELFYPHMSAPTFDYTSCRRINNLSSPQIHQVHQNMLHPIFISHHRQLLLLLNTMFIHGQIS